MDAARPVNANLMDDQRSNDAMYRYEQAHPRALPPGQRRRPKSLPLSRGPRAAGQGCGGLAPGRSQARRTMPRRHEHLPFRDRPGMRPSAQVMSRNAPRIPGASRMPGPGYVSAGGSGY
jgi:hypothetical protein